MIVKSMVGDQPNALLEQYIVETASDLDDILTDYATTRHITKTLPFGSIAFVLATRTFYMVGLDSNSNKTWIDISQPPAQGAATLAQYFADTMTEITDDDVTALIPSFFEDKTALQRAEFANLTTIGNRAFFDCADLVSVIAPKLTTIGVSAFEGCLKLHEFTHGNVTVIPDRAFFGDVKLSVVDQPSLTSIGASAFQGCTALTSLDLPSLTDIGGYAFDGHTLTSISFPELRTAGRYALRSDTLLELDVGKMTELNGANLFNGCPNLRKVKADYLETLTIYYGTGPFVGYPYITLLDFPRLNTICASAFSRSTSLSVLILRAETVCTLSNINAFDQTPFAANGTGGTLYAPQALISQYENSTNWSVVLAYQYNQILPIEGSPYE